ncbi:RagB/SusD family nutrient uptake outer membrane protein [Parabacteroides sp. Marseille-P3160]|uniref:RagB/SusD family nutrient uptake outer membrane protein n=1 Tax=Parabacteroides sp. Marseille-P3160 TaxID=1917887 RepID=UPI0009BAD26F|nr:RagB/SusD family nutrient uptake outer membrane protein [Parabacteroides sp. Marseille-P3160]
MKKIVFEVTLLCCLLLNGCDLERLPLNGPTTGSFPASEEEATMGLYAAYKGLSLLDASSTPIIHVMDNITDVGYARPGGNYTPSITSSVTTDNALATKPWEYHYKTIARCHLVLDNLEKLKSEISENDYNQLDAELRVIRAYCYSQLIELYGDVPLVMHTLTLEENEFPKESMTTVQQWIIDELTAVADHLPVSQPNYGNVRVGSVAAYMLKARVALYSKQYNVAAEAAAKAIQLSEGVYELTPFDNSSAYCNQTYEAGEPECSNIFGYDGYATSKEWIWVIEYSQLISGNTHNQGYYMGSRLGKGCAYWGPTQNFIDSFQDINGKPIDQSEIYDAADPFTNRDPRLDMYCARPHARLMGFQFEANTKYSKVKNYWPVIKGESDAPSSVSNTDATNAYRTFSGYYWRKHTDNKDYETNSSKGVSDLNCGIFRYAELLLIYAEAKIEANKIDASVYDAIDKIRTRAGMPVLERNLSQSQLRTALRYERKIELCNDGLRWYDLRRWDIADKIMNGYLYLNRSGNTWTKGVITRIDENYTPIYNHEEAKKYFTTQEVVYKKEKDELWPIAQSELDSNKKLTQNPGY